MDIPRAGTMGKNATVKNIIYAILVVALLFYTIFPLYWLFLASLKTRVDLFTIPPKFVFEPTFDHFKKIFIYTSVETGEQQQTRYLFWLLNSVLTAGIGTLLAVTLGTMAGYINSRMEYRGKKDFMFFVLSTRMLPPVAVIVPLYIVFAKLHLADTRLGMILLYTMIGLGLATWIMKGFFDNIPKEVEEAAFVNGYTRFQVFIKVLVPMVKGGIAVATAGLSILASSLADRYLSSKTPCEDALEEIRKRDRKAD